MKHYIVLQRQNYKAPDHPQIIAMQLFIDFFRSYERRSYLCTKYSNKDYVIYPGMTSLTGRTHGGFSFKRAWHRLHAIIDSLLITDTIRPFDPI